LISAKLTEKQYWLFAEYCHERGLTQSEMVRTMIETILDEDKPKQQTEELHIT
jgi:hypothetical protein